MTGKEIAELRRHLRPDRHSITQIRGCYVSAQKEILSEFSQSVGLMTQEEHEKYLTLLKRVLSGTVNRNLHDISFRTRQVADSEEHRLLNALRTSSLKDDAAVERFYRTVVDALCLEDNYLILLACDHYDVPFRAKDDRELTDQAEEVFTYILCTICPVRQAKPSLSYDLAEKEFHNQAGRWSVCAPEVGFLFPAFDGRRTNLYGALYYARDLAENHDPLISALFDVQLPMPAAAQKQAFASVLGESLGPECSFEVVQTVHEQLSDMIELHKQSKAAEPLVVSGSQVRSVLESCGISDEKAAAFSVKCEAQFGADAVLSPGNLIDEKRFQLKTPDVLIQVAPNRSDLVQTRRIGGSKYILICADEGVEVNGVDIHFPEDEQLRPLGRQKGDSQ